MQEVYCSSYKPTQQTGLKAAQEKINLNVDNIKKLSALTLKRIAASGRDIKRIQYILVSSYALLPDRDFLKSQKITYEKLSKPRCLITKFGVSPLKVDRLSIDKPQGEGASIFFDPETVYSKTWIFNSKGQLEGILEIHVPLPHFKETLKLGSTLSFAPSTAHVLFQKKPFPIYGKLPESFRGYCIQNVSHFALFFLFVMLTVVFVAVSNFYSRFRIKQNVREEMESLKEALSTLQEDSHKENDAFLITQKQTATHQVTCQSYKTFQTSFQNHQRERLHHVLRSLDVVINSFKSSGSSLPIEELMELVHDCLNVVERLSHGLPSAGKHEPVKVIKN